MNACRTRDTDTGVPVPDGTQFYRGLFVAGTIILVGTSTIFGIVSYWPYIVTASRNIVHINRARAPVQVRNYNRSTRGWRGRHIQGTGSRGNYVQYRLIYPPFPLIPVVLSPPLLSHSPGQFRLPLPSPAARSKSCWPGSQPSQGPKFSARAPSISWTRPASCPRSSSSPTWRVATRCPARGHSCWAAFPLAVVLLLPGAPKNNVPRFTAKG